MADDTMRISGHEVPREIGAHLLATEGEAGDLRREVAELRQALRKYGQHYGVCRGRREGWHTDWFGRICLNCGETLAQHGGRLGRECPLGSCTCGFDALLAQPAAWEERERG